MLNFSGLAIRRGTRQLFSGASFIIHRGNRVGVTGANGCGKSSLFALLLGQIQSDEGGISMPPGLSIAHVAQETPGLERAAIEYVLDGDQELRSIQQQLQQAEQADDGTAQAECHHRLDVIDAYTAPARAGKLLLGLGFKNDQLEQPVSSFSGGWRMRLNLAQALMCRSDLLLLDEPTNHLDLDAVIWLEDWLLSYPGTLLLISHDRDFLDRVVDHVMHIEQQGVKLYTGNYSEFETRRAEQLAQQQALYEKQQQEVAHIESFVRRFRAKASKAKQAQSRLKTLQRMELISRAHVDSPFHFSFSAPDKLPHPLLSLDQVAVGYGDTPVVSDISLSILPGDRIGLLGHNGAGKSTLIKLLAGDLSAMQGDLTASSELKIGYFAQHQLEQLDPQASPMLHLQRLDAQLTEQAIRDYLGGFNFQGDRVLEPVAPFSGGEKARLVLALLIYQKPNLLLLDEPTNHLDLDMRHALSLALQDYAGAMLLVSHDRHLLRSVSEQFLLVDRGHLRPFDDDLDAYRSWLLKESATSEAPSTAGTDQALSRKQQRQQEAEQRRALQPLKKDINHQETLMENINAELGDIEQSLAGADIYQAENREQLQALQRRQGELRKQLEQAEERWFQLSEQLQALES